MRKTSSPKSLSAVSRTRDSALAKSSTASSVMPGSELGYVGHVVAVGAQTGDGRRVDSLVGKQPHATDLDSG